jgi:ABC-2 type transport system ATP-binding protein
MVARALMHAPQVLFLDEPTTGLDPAARLFVWDRVRDLRGRGVTVVLTTHDMDEATELADRVGIMDHGKLLALDTPEALTRGLPGSTTLEVTVAPGDGTPAEELLAALGAIDGVERVERVEAGMAGPPGRRARRPSGPRRPRRRRPAGAAAGAPVRRRRRAADGGAGGHAACPAGR